MVVFFCVIIIPTPVWVFDLDFNWGVAKINDIFIFLLVMPKYEGKSNERREKERKSVLTTVSINAWTNIH